MNKDVVFNVKAKTTLGTDLVFVSIYRGRHSIDGCLNRAEWEALRSGLTPTSSVDFIIRDEDEGRRVNQAVELERDRDSGACDE